MLGCHGHAIHASAECMRILLLLFFFTWSRIANADSTCRLSSDQASIKILTFGNDFVPWCEREIKLKHVLSHQSWFFFMCTINAWGLNSCSTVLCCVKYIVVFCVFVTPVMVIISFDVFVSGIWVSWYKVWNLVVASTKMADWTRVTVLWKSMALT